MKSAKIFFITLCFLSETALAMAQLPAGREWQKISAGVLEAHFGTLATASVTPQIIFLDSRTSLWRSLDEGRRWTRIFSLPGEHTSEIHRVYVSPHHSEWVYLATSEGLYASQDQGNHFERIFTSAQTKERDCHSLAFHPLDPDILFLGTGNGLFWTLDEGETWHREPIEFDGEEIIKIIPNPGNDGSLLVLTPSCLNSIHEKTGALKTLFSLTPPSPDEEIHEADTGKQNVLNDFSLIPDEENKILLATQKGILEGFNSGNSWNSFAMHGLKSQEIVRIIAADSGRIFAATRLGVYQYAFSKKRWEELKNGPMNIDSKDLHYHPAQGGTLFTVTRDGAFRIPVPVSLEIDVPSSRNIEIRPVDFDALNQYFSREPNLRMIHEAAIQYGDLSPEKISRWHRQSRIRRLLPKLSAGMARDLDQNIDIDRGGTIQPDVFIMGPDEKSWNTDVSLSWDLADLIWSSDQTSIDSRSKLMTELRNEILSNLTRLYFERRRLLTEHFLNPPPDELAQLDLRQRIEELTAHLDAYTGGFFTEELERRKMTPLWSRLKTPEINNKNHLE